MGLPDQTTPKDSYSYDEVQHLIARDWARSEIKRLSEGQIELHRQMLDAIGTTNQELKAMRDVIITFPGLITTQISDCRKDMRREVEADFPSRLDAMNMERRIEDKVAETDKTLGLQIAAVGKKATDDFQSLKDQLTCVENKVDRQWLRITVIVSTVVSLGLLVQWLLMFYNALPH